MKALPDGDLHELELLRDPAREKGWDAMNLRDLDAWITREQRLPLCVTCEIHAAEHESGRCEDCEEHEKEGDDATKENS